MVVFPAPPTSWLSVTRFGPNLFGSRYGSANKLFPQKFDHRWVQICSNRFGHIGGHHFLPRQQTNTKDIAGQSARQQCHLEMYEGSRQCMNAVMTPTGATGLILINLQCCGCFPFSSFVSKQLCCDPLSSQHPGDPSFCMVYCYCFCLLLQLYFLLLFCFEAISLRSAVVGTSRQSFQPTSISFHCLLSPPIAQD